MSLTLYHSPQTRSSTILWMLEEVGVSYIVELVDVREERHRTPAFLAINPLGKVPAIVHDGVTITESGAILTYLADAFPQANLAPAFNDRKRGPYLRWLFTYSAAYEPAVVDRALKREAGAVGMSPYGSFDRVIDTMAAALKTGPWLLGETFSAADVQWGAGLGWTMMFGLVPKRPEFEAYVARVEARPARLRAQAKDAAFKAQLS